MWKLANRNPVNQPIADRAQQSFDALIDRGDIGFKDTKLFKNSVAAVKELVSKHTFSDKVVVVGIGGSALGAKAFCEALFPTEWQQKILFLDNVDAFMMREKLESFNKVEDATWVLISKSGGTIETVTTFDYCRQFLLNKTGIDIVERSVVITEEKDSPLYNFAKQYNRPWLPVPFEVGGRFSVFTPVGLFPLALMGLDLAEVERGIHQALEDEQLTRDLAGELMTSLMQSEHNLYVFSYSDRLQGFGLWLQQLWSESLGKAKNRKGEPAPVASCLIPCRGASDQHSVLQQVMEGPEKKFVCFVRENQAEFADEVIEKSLFNNELMVGKNIGQLLAAEAQATADSLSEKGVRSLTLKAEGVNSSSLSSLMMTWMLVVGTLGEMLDINAFDQPGVESGKRLARRVLGASD